MFLAMLFVSVWWGFGTDITLYVAKWGIAQRCPCKTKYPPSFRESTNPPFFEGGGFVLGFLPIFHLRCLKHRKNTPNKKRGLRKRGLVDHRESTNPPFFKGGFLFWGFCLFFFICDALIGAEKTMTATDVTGFDAIFSTGFFATFSRF